MLENVIQCPVKQNIVNGGTSEGNFSLFAFVLGLIKSFKTSPQNLCSGLLAQLLRLKVALNKETLQVSYAVSLPVTHGYDYWLYIKLFKYDTGNI